MTLTSERRPTTSSYKHNPSPMIRDGLRLAAKIERLEGHPVGQPDTPLAVEDYLVPHQSPIKVDSPDTPPELVQVHTDIDPVPEPERIGQTRRLALGARALAGSIIERFGTPSVPRHRARRIGLAGLNAFRPTGGKHKRTPGSHKATPIAGGKHRA